jgi:hypothetical protein
MPKEENETLEDKVSNAVTEVATSVADTKSDADKSEDAKLELFARKVSDAVTKNIAELLSPSKKTETLAEDEEEIEEEPGKKVRRKRTKTVDIRPPKKRIFTFLG